MPGKIYTQIGIVTNNMECIQSALSKGNFAEASKQWQLAKSAYAIYEQHKKTMTGPTKLRPKKTKMADMKKFEDGFERFKNDFGSARSGSSGMASSGKRSRTRPMTASNNSSIRRGLTYAISSFSKSQVRSWKVAARRTRYLYKPR